MIFESSLPTVVDRDWGSVVLEPAIVFEPEEVLVLLVGTIVDMVDEEDIGLE